MHGWIIIDKPLGPGSTQIVSAVKRALREGGYGKHKVGHGGTLDPLATGVLPVAIGEATKLAGRMLDASKRYDFTIRFGAQTDTLDLEGKVIAESPVRPTLAAIESVLAQFTGPIEQVPPAYSALKVDGERAYDLARKGEEVVLATRQVSVFELQILPVPGRSLKKSPFRPSSRRAPISAASRATSRWRSARWAMSPCFAAPRPAPSPSPRPFRWTNWRNWVRATRLKKRSCHWGRGWTTSRLCPSTPIRQGGSARGFD